MEYQCKKCKKTKNEAEFYKNNTYKSGRFSKCIECCKQYYSDNEEHERKVRRERYLRNRKKNARQRREYAKEYYKKHKKDWIEKARVAKRKYPEKWKARQDLRNAVASGKIEKLPCEICGNLKSQGHHEDYSKPLEVKWLCAKHHAELHSQIN